LPKANLVRCPADALESTPALLVLDLAGAARAGDVGDADRGVKDDGGCGGRGERGDGGTPSRTCDSFAPWRFEVQTQKGQTSYSAGFAKNSLPVQNSKFILNSLSLRSEMCSRLYTDFDCTFYINKYLTVHKSSR
jgi:hypothetical protein